jgi:hypothetical protein
VGLGPAGIWGPLRCCWPQAGLSWRGACSAVPLWVLPLCLAAWLRWHQHCTEMFPGVLASHTSACVHHHLALQQALPLPLPACQAEAGMHVPRAVQALQRARPPLCARVQGLAPLLPGPLHLAATAAARCFHLTPVFVVRTSS